MRSIHMTVLAATLAVPMLAVAGTSSVPAAKADVQAKAAPQKEYVVRDWAKMDTNKDHLISPEEMIAYIEANPGPLAKTRKAAQADMAPAAAPRTAAAAQEAPVTLR